MADKPLPPAGPHSGAKNAGSLGGSPLPAPPPALPPANPDNPTLSPGRFGGQRGGKKTLSGFPVDSPEHAEFVREREAERSRKRRAAVAAAVAPPLPAAPPAAHLDKLPAALPALPPMGTPLPDPAPAPVNGALPDAGLSLNGDFVPWTLDDVAPLLKDGLVPLAEEIWLDKFLAKAVRNNLPATVLKKMEAEAKFSDAGKNLITKGGAADLVRLLNESGVSAKHKGSSQWVLGMVLVAAGCMSKLKARNATIAEHTQNKPTPAEPEKKP